MEAHPNRDFPAFCMPVVGDFDLMVSLSRYASTYVSLLGPLKPAPEGLQRIAYGLAYIPLIQV